MREVPLYAEARGQLSQFGRSLNQFCVYAILGMAYVPIIAYMGTSLIRNSADPGPYSRAMPRALWWS